MRTLSLAKTKAHLSAVIDQVQAGEEFVITRRGKAVARVIPEPDISSQDQELIVRELREFLDRQSPVKETAVDLVREIRDDARY